MHKDNEVIENLSLSSFEFVAVVVVEPIVFGERF